MAYFEIRDLSFSYPENDGRPALDHIDLTVGKGEYITVCGKSGCGKTTMLRHLKSVLAPHGRREGTILFKGRELDEISEGEQAAGIGYVMQNPDDQIVTDKVWHELAFGLESLGTDQKTMRLRVAEMASYFGIQEWFHRNVAELSGGQKQLLNLASVMAMQPEILILDEPTSQLDPIAASDFLNTVRKINLELGTTVIISEHRLEEIYHLSDRVVVMHEGRIIADDTPEGTAEILRRTGHEMAAALPAPVRIYHGTDSRMECPLTVRDGRKWLSAELGETADLITELPEKENEGGDSNIAVLKDVWFRYEKDEADILKGLSMEIPRNKLSAIVGGNGTGKSTALKAICGICRPYRGKITIKGRSLSRYRRNELFRGNLAMLPQDPSELFVKKTVKEELEEMLDAEDPQKDSRIASAAEFCDIVELYGRHPFDLSGGEQQRVALAKVLLTEPDILLLDEPTKGMDDFFKIQFASVLEDLKAKGISIVMVTHDIEFCAEYADKVGLFFDGGIITEDTPQRFFTGNSFYTTAANRMSRHISGSAVTCRDVIQLWRMNREKQEI